MGLARRSGRSPKTRKSDWWSLCLFSTVYAAKQSSQLQNDYLRQITSSQADKEIFFFFLGGGAIN